MVLSGDCRQEYESSACQKCYCCKPPSGHTPQCMQTSALGSPLYVTSTNTNTIPLFLFRIQRWWHNVMHSGDDFYQWLGLTSTSGPLSGSTRAAALGQALGWVPLARLGCASLPSAYVSTAQNLQLHMPVREGGALLVHLLSHPSIGQRIILYCLLDPLIAG